MKKAGSSGCVAAVGGTWGDHRRGELTTCYTEVKMLGLRVASRFTRLGLRGQCARAFSLPAHEVVPMPALSPTMETVSEK